MMNRGGSSSGGWRVHPPTASAAAGPVVSAASAIVGRGGSGVVGGDNSKADEEYWRRFDNSVNALSFGFVATAILISMFLVMAIFERFLRPTRSDQRNNNAGGGGVDSVPPPHSHPGGYLGAGSVGEEFRGVFEYPSPKVMVSTTDISVLMPGQDIPTFIAHAAPT